MTRYLVRRASRSFEVRLPNVALKAYELAARPSLESIRKTIVNKGIRWSNLQTLFVHVPKCGGTSMNQLLLRADFEIVMSLDQLKKLIVDGQSEGPRSLSLDHLNTDILISLGLVSKFDLERIVSFSVVRNPYSRVLSSFDFHKKRGFISEKTLFADYLKMLNRNWKTNVRNVFGLSHALPATYFLQPNQWKGPERILQLEDHLALENFMAQTFGEKSSLPHLNLKRPGAQRLMSSEDAEKVKHLYREDFVIGSYSTSAKGYLG